MTQQTLFLDLDGVIADFARGYQELFNRNAYADDSFTINQVCLQDPHFFRKLKIIPEGMELLNQLRNKYRIVFLTTPMENMQYCKWDKIAWIEENIGKEFDVIFAIDKSQYVVDEKSILIDDMKHNLDEWTAAGGTSIKFPQQIDKILAIIEETLNPAKEIHRVKKELKNIDINLIPTPAQKIAQNYKKGKIRINDIDILIENIPGSIRWGRGFDGKRWTTKMHDFYGYIQKSEGNDYDPIDIFINPKGVSRSLVFIINQAKPDGMFDEIKCMLGYETEDEAKKAYLRNYQKGWEKNIISIVRTNTKKLREWLLSGNKFEPFEYKKEIKSVDQFRLEE